MTESSTPTPEKKPDNDEVDFRKIMEVLREAAPHIAQAMAKKAEQETQRHKHSLWFWGLPFLVVIGTLGSLTLGLAALALWKDKPDAAQTIVGYLLTFLGGVGTGQLVKSRTG